jgi:preprotein translocase subunit SecG
MTIVLTLLHILVSLALIFIVLLQTGKGADIGAAFGAGSSQTMFGSRGAATFLQKATAAAAITFMLTSMALTYTVNKSRSHSVAEKGGAKAPASQAPTGALPGSPVTPVSPGRSAPSTPAPKSQGKAAGPVSTPAAPAAPAAPAPSGKK